MVYSGDPNDGPVDAVRFWLQDTGDPPLLSDTEINYFINYAAAYSADPILIASALCAVVMAKYAGEVNISGDGITYSGQELQDKYRQLGQELQDTYRLLNGNTAFPIAGGTLRFEYRDFCLKAPLFAIGMDDNPRGASQLDPYYGDYDEGYGNGEIYP